MKRRISNGKYGYVLAAFILVVATVLSFSAMAAESTPVSVSKDGLIAEMTLTPNADSPEKISLLLKITNESAENTSNISASLILPEGVSLSSGEDSNAVTVAVGETKELCFELINADALPETTPEATETDAPAGGCGSAVAYGAVIVALICSAFFVVKNPKRGISCMLSCLMLLSAFAFVIPAEAATTHRKISLSDKFNYEDKEYEVKAEITYDFTFTETKGTDTKGMDKFEITYYYGPQGQDLCNEEYIKKIAECGFTSIPIEGYDPTINKTALGYLRKYGLTCSALADHRISAALASTDQAAIDSYINDVVNDYKDYLDVINGWLLRDEPSAADFPALARVVDAFSRIDPERETMINLFPTYASDKQLGTNGYQEHIDKFISTVKPDYISYDHYHFRKGENRKGFFENIEIIRDSAISSELDYMLIILLTEHMGYDDLTKYQIEWEVNMCLTYGMKRVSYFTFWLGHELLAEGWSNACMDANGKIYPHYYDVQEINKWLLPLGEELFDKNSTSVFHTRSKGGGSLEKGCEFYTAYGDLGEVNGAGFVIGFFDDGSFMITNKSYADIANARNPFEFIDVTEGLEYFDANSGEWKDAEAAGIVARNENGNYTHTFEPGEGILFRVK